MKKPRVLISTIIILTSFLLLPSLSPSVHAAPGTVCLIDPSASSCPTSPASLTGTLGTQQRVSVFLQGTNVINGFDITLLANHTILKPAGYDLTGSILPAPQQVVDECLGGVLVQGPQCLATDTSDTLHLAVVACPGCISSATTGLLFTAIYNVTAPSSGIPLGFQTGCSNTSVSPSTCVTITNGTAQPVPETVQTATFGTSTTPDFAISANPTSIIITAGSSATSTISVTSVNGFSGTVNLAATISPSGPGLSISPASVTIASGQTMTSTLTVSSSTATSPGTYTITVSGTSGMLVHSVTVSLTVNPPPQPDFTMAANPVSLTIQAGSSAASTITLTSVNGFSGTISLTSSISPPGPTPTLSATSVTLSAGGTGTTTLTVSTTTSTPSGSYTAQVVGSSGTLSHPVTVSVSVNPAPSFTLSASPTSLTVIHGSSGTSTINLTSVGGFAGTINLSSSIAPNSRRAPTTTLSASSVTLSSGGNGSVVLTISTNKHTLPGTYTITITGTSGSLATSTTITLTVT